MDKRKLSSSILAVLGAIFLSYILTTPGNAMSSQMGKPLVASSVVILNSGSTNTCAYTIQVSLTGTATYSVCRIRHGWGVLPRQLTHAFFQDINAAKPLPQIPVEGACLKPISFASKTYILYDSQWTPDVSCASNEVGQKLNNDAENIVGTLKLPIQK